MSGFLVSLKNRERSNDGDFFRIRILSNSVDIPSSKINNELSKTFDSVLSFVGIHPEIVLTRLPAEIRLKIGEMMGELSDLMKDAQGLGEIGLDTKYGYEELQLELFKLQLKLAEQSSHAIPITIHSRNTLPKIIQALSTFDLSRNTILFHWFAGNDQELAELQSRGYYVSFGPSLLSSNRLSKLVKVVEEDLLLPETDSPITFANISEGEPISPFGISSVIFRMAQILGKTYEEMIEITDRNLTDYIQAQSSLRVKGQ